MKYLLILFISSVSLFAQKSIEIEFTRCDENQSISIEYIDFNEDGIFDKLSLNKCGDTSNITLNSFYTDGKPNSELYKKSRFQIRLLNYNHVRQDAYFRIYVLHRTGELGYWEHVMGSHKLIWHEL